MTPEEFLEQIRKSEEQIKQAEQTGEAFIKQLTTWLTEHVYNWYSEWQTKRSGTEKQVIHIAEECAGKVLQLFDSIAYNCKKGEQIQKSYTVPQPRSREDSEMELQEILKIIPKKDHDYMKQIHWEDFEQERHQKGFCFETHRLMKKTLTIYYREEIIDLEPGHLRQLDNYVYNLGAWPFVEKCYDLME